MHLSTSRKISPRRQQSRPPSVCGPWATGPVCTRAEKCMRRELKRWSRAKRAQRGTGCDDLSWRKEAGSSGRLAS